MVVLVVSRARIRQTSNKTEKSGGASPQTSNGPDKVIRPGGPPASYATIPGLENLGTQPGAKDESLSRMKT